MTNGDAHVRFQSNLTADGARPPAPRRRSTLSVALMGGLAFLFFITFIALGTWQLQRRVWKLDLIARADQRVHAPPVPAPAARQWAHVTAATDEYRHVALAGVFLDRAQTLVQAVTDLGAGYWVLTPLRTTHGDYVLVNRGFVPGDARDRIRPGGAAAITGLLRMTEPRGAFLRHNDASANRWYSRDVAAIAQARGLTNVAPYFVDADAATASAQVPGEIATSGSTTSGAADPVPPASGPTTLGSTTAGTTTLGSTSPGAATLVLTTPGSTTSPSSVPTTSGAATSGAATSMPTTPVPTTSGSPTSGATTSGAATFVVPVGGLTVIRFRNSHLAYAITWYTLALMVVAALWVGFRGEAHT